MKNLPKQPYLTTKSSLLKWATLMLPKFFSQLSKMLTISLGLLKASQKDTLRMVSVWFGCSISVTAAYFPVSWCIPILSTFPMLGFLHVSWKLHELATTYWYNEWWICLTLQKGPSKWTKYYSFWTLISFR